MIRPSALAIVLCCATPALAADPPSRVLDLARWKVTLPVDTDLPGHPDEIVPRALAQLVDPAHFFVRDQGVVFRAPCGGVTTRGSSYPRCELREMAPGGKDEATWSTTDTAPHTLHFTAAITKVPARKPHVVIAQIHDAKNDLLMVRLEGDKLFIERQEGGDVPLQRPYVLGAPIDIKIEAGAGRIQAWLGGELKMDWPVNRKGCYFKAGCYTQSNPQNGDDPADYGEVVITALHLGRQSDP